MFKDVFANMTGVEIWPIIAMFIFMGLFFAIVIWVVRLDKKFVNKMKRLPLDSEPLNNGGDRNG